MWHLLHEFGAQGVDALNHEHLVVVESQPASAFLAASCLEVVARKLHFLAVEEGVDLAVQQFQVQGVQMLVVVVSILVARCFLAVYEIVVERDGHRLNAVGEQLYAYALAGGCLAAR